MDVHAAPSRRHCRIFKRLHTRHPHTAAHTRTLGVPQVLGVGTDTGCASASVLLFFDRRRFLFNAGEGFQRFATEHRVRLSRVDAVLLTRSTSSAAGGLPIFGIAHSVLASSWALKSPKL